MTIFTDASAIVSLYDLSDSNHEKAQKLAQANLNNYYLVSDFVFAEIVTILSQKTDKEIAIRVGNHIKNHYSWVKTDGQIMDLAWEIFKKHASKNASFVDCTTIAFYQKGAFDKCFTFDQHFKSSKVPLLG